MSDITLEHYEYAMASEVGRMRMLSSLRKGSKHKYGMTKQGWTEHIEGAGAEVAVAKHLGLYWSGSVDTYKSEPDVGDDIEVRWRSQRHWDLLVRPDDPEDRFYVLVVGFCPVYTIIGGMWGWEAKRDEWLQAHGGRPKAWFVPQNELNTIWGSRIT